MENIESATTAHARWRAGRIEALTRPDGWLTLVGLVWLDDGSHRVGGGATSDIVLPVERQYVGTLDVSGTTISWHPASQAAMALRTDAGGEATVVREGAVSFFAIERDGRLALRIRDEQAATRRNFAGIECFAFDPAWRIEASWNGEAASFQSAGHACRLTPQDSTASTLHFVIADTTSGRETYGGGRFLYAEAPAGGRVVLDFNRAVNPPCAFTPFAVCPLPPPGNRLPMAVRAGEQAWRPPPD